MNLNEIHPGTSIVKLLKKKRKKQLLLINSLNTKKIIHNKRWEMEIQIKCQRLKENDNSQGTQTQRS